MDIQKFISREKARGDCFRLLSACFYQPHKEAFIQEEFFKNLEALLTQAVPDAAAHVSAMGKAFMKYSEEDLLVDYARLFVGPAELLAPPYGSIYLDGEKKVMGDSTMEVIKIYEAQGLAMDSEFNNLPDHITAELEFMYYLIFKEIEALERSETGKAIELINTQELFLNNFLKRWVKPFCGKIKQGASGEYYRALADCVSAFIESPQHSDNIPVELRATITQN
ncbi:MAG: molecular chaperone TorD family protein [Nitrospirae bacterium]|nr:molecular chaperone TorD family protein [Nitrospirota bacterium]